MNITDLKVGDRFQIAGLVRLCINPNPQTEEELWNAMDSMRTAPAGKYEIVEVYQVSGTCWACWARVTSDAIDGDWWINTIALIRGARRLS